MLKVKAVKIFIKHNYLSFLILIDCNKTAKDHLISSSSGNHLFGNW
jgi:hypothetical protein